MSNWKPEAEGLVNELSKRYPDKPNSEVDVLAYLAKEIEVLKAKVKKLETDTEQGGNYARDKV